MKSAILLSVFAVALTSSGAVPAATKSKVLTVASGSSSVKPSNSGAVDSRTKTSRTLAGAFDSTPFTGTVVILQ